MSSNSLEQPRVSAFCDGGGSNLTGFSAAFVLYTEDGTLLYRYGEKLNAVPATFHLLSTSAVHSSNQAEYASVLLMLSYILNIRTGISTLDNTYTPLRYNNLRINVFMDSQLVINQINRVYKTNDEVLKQLLKNIDYVKEVLESFGTTVRFYWIPRESNKVADKLQKDVANGKII